MSPSRFHLYLGYAAWAPGQLEAEIQLGAWTVLSHDLKIVFDPDPDSLWLRLTDESQMQIASGHTSRSNVLDPSTEPGALATGLALLQPGNKPKAASSSDRVCRSPFLVEASIPL
jgi:hypothetical protein